MLNNVSTQNISWFVMMNRIEKTGSRVGCIKRETRDQQWLRLKYSLSNAAANALCPLLYSLGKDRLETQGQ